MHVSSASRAPSAPAPRLRNTETPLELPTARRTVLLLARLLRLRCPHCGGGAVLEWKVAVRERCSACGFRYERSDDNYFQGAMFFHFMLAGGSFIASFLAVLVLAWPNVPWDALTYGAPVLFVLVTIALYPVSKAVWLTVDVLVRPVLPLELE
jgi:uncharacterized protein (DUF983 family)